VAVVKDGWSRYLTPSGASRQLGLVCLGGGAERVVSGGPRDRELSSYLVALITAGRGSIATAPSGPCEIVAPALFWLFPGVRHTYMPDPSGWTVAWVMFEGPAADTYLDLGYVTPAAPVDQLTDVEPIARLFARFSSWLRDEYWLSAGHPEVEAAAAVHELIVAVARERAGGGSIAPALVSLRRNACEPWTIEEHARAAGVSVSALREQAQADAGCGPKEFVLRHRLNRAKELLAETDLPVSAIARRVGVDDAAYFSRLFVRHVGVPPSAFRRQRV